ncbi:MAG TPA: hypothetical protein VFF46_13250, partial [Kribbella sp.]|nr:hypothetical protein [Kribbella sp.]
MIKPEGIPVEDLDRVAAAIQQNAGPLGKLGQGFSDVGNNVHKSFGGLNEVYHAPEREVLVNSTQLVQKNLTEFGSNLPQISHHLTVFGDGVQAKADRLRAIRADAYDWMRRKNGNPDWQNDQWMIDKNNQMVQDVHNIMTVDLPDMSFRCANAILALFGGKPWDPKTGARQGETPKQGGDDKQEEPWGTPEERDRPWYLGALHAVGQFLVGVVQVIGEAIEGILTVIPVLPALGSIDGVRKWAKSTFGYDIPTWDAAGKAWVGLKDLAVGLTALPFQLAWWGFDAVTGKDTRPQWVKDIGEKSLEIGKSLIAWDEWSKNPAKALGMVLTNVATTVGTGGVAAGAKAVATAGKLGKLSLAAAKVAKAAEYVQGVKIGLHDGALGLATKIPKVADVVDKMAKIPIVGHNFQLHTPKADIPVVTAADTGGSVAHHAGDVPGAHTGVPESRAGTSNVDIPSAHTGDGPGVHTGDGGAVHTGVGDGLGAHVGDGAGTHAGVGDGPGAHAGVGPGAHPGVGDGPGTHAGVGDGPGSHVGDGPGAHAGDGPGAGTQTSRPDPLTGRPASHPDPQTGSPNGTHDPTHTDPTTPAGRHQPDQPVVTPPVQPVSHAHPGSTTPGHTETPTGRTDPGTSAGRTDPGTSARRTDPGTSTGRTDPGTSTGRTDPGTSTGHTDPGTSAGRTDPGTSTGRTDPGTPTPAGHHEHTTHDRTEPTSSRTEPSDRRGTEQTKPEPGRTRTPEPTTPGTDHTHTPDPTTRGTDRTHTPEPTTPGSDRTHTPEPTTPGTDRTHTPEPRTGETNPEPRRTPEDPGAARTNEPPVVPVTPVT